MRFSEFSLKIVLVFLFFSIFICGCQKKSLGKNNKNENLSDFDFFPTSIISLSPAATEILFSIGAENQIVAVSDFSDYPPQTQNLPKIGGFDGKTLSFEKILSFKPDFVYLTNGMHNFLIEQLEQNGIKYYLSDATSVSEIFDEISEVGALIGHEKKATQVVSLLKSRLEDIQKNQNSILPAVYYEVWNEPFMSCGSSSFVSDVISLAGGKNIFADLKDSYPIVSEEAIISKNPQYIIIAKSSSVSEDVIKNRIGWSNLNAVKNNQIYIIDDDLLCRPAPRILDSIEQLSAIFSKK